MTTARIGNLVIHKGQAMYPVAEQDKVVTIEIENSRHPQATVNLQELRAALGDDPIQREQLLRELQSKQEDMDRVTASLARAERAASDYYQDITESRAREKRLRKVIGRRERTIKAFRLVVKELSR
ncbi:MAG: hypothetical protein EOL90_09405 [Spartobacteria bacterium]|nr:hypothetical protein [Spartobacteria bacterium]